jgi:hypothetical protein
VRGEGLSPAAVVVWSPAALRRILLLRVLIYSRLLWRINSVFAGACSGLHGPGHPPAPVPNGYPPGRLPPVTSALSFREPDMDMPLSHGLGLAAPRTA